MSPSRRRRRPFALLAATAALALGAPASASAACPGADVLPAAGTATQVADATLCLLNEERSRAGLSPLARQRQLDAAAGRHARDMVARGYFGHQAPSGSHAVDRIRATGYLASTTHWVVGENLAWGTGSFASPEHVVRSWMASPGHRANILKPRYREIGFGLALGTPGRSDGAGGTFATTFGARVVAKRSARKASRSSARRAARTR